MRIQRADFERIFRIGPYVSSSAFVRKAVIFCVKMKKENKYVPNQDAPDSTSESKRIESQFNFGRVQLWHAPGCVYHPDASSWLLKTSKTRWNACIFETRSSTFIKRSWMRLYNFRNAYRRIWGRNSEKSRSNASGWNTERTQTQLVCVSHLHGSPHTCKTNDSSIDLFDIAFLLRQKKLSFARSAKQRIKSVPKNHQKCSFAVKLRLNFFFSDNFEKSIELVLPNLTPCPSNQ